MPDTETIKLILSIWGALLASVLGIIKLIDFFRNKVKMNVNANLIFKTIGKDEACKGTKVDSGKRGFNEILLNVEVVNSGRKSAQITSIIIEDGKTNNITQVIPEKLPILLDPLTSVQLEIQKEWVDNTEVTFFGVIDAVGKRYGIKKGELQTLLIETNKYPSNKKKYVNKTNPEDEVEAFQSFDKSVITNKNNEKLYGR